MRYFWVFLLIFTSTLQAQVLKLPAEPTGFIEEYQKQTAKLAGQERVRAANDEFVALFENTLDTDGKTAMMKFINLLSSKGVNPLDIVKTTEVFGKYVQSQNPSNIEFTSFINLLIQGFDPYPAKTILDSIIQLDGLFENNNLYTSSFNRLHITNPKFAVRYFEKEQDYFSDQIIETAQKEEDVDWGWGENLEDFDAWKPDIFAEEDSRLKLSPVKGPYLIFESIDFILISPSDSLIIKNTSGAYNFITTEFVGQGGALEWHPDNNQAEATFDKYSFKASSGVLRAEKVSLIHLETIDQPIEGALEIKLEKRNKGEKPTYPRFKSYRNNANYLLGLEDFELIGGYTLVGDRITTSSLYDQYTKFTANKGSPNTEFEVIGTSLQITDSLITSDRVSFVARIGSDSISHPAIQFAYNLPEKHVQLVKVKSGGYRNSMFADTFHQVDIRCDAMSWDISSGKMDFYIISGKDVVAAQFESFDYYNGHRLRGLSSAAGFNPLMTAATIVGRKKVNRITIDEMMQLSKKERHQVSNGMLIGSQMGFFDFHPFENYYSISRKGMHYYMVYTGRKDFDDLVFSSLNTQNTGQSNASIDFESRSLEITGAQNFRLSDSLGIQLVPDNQSMKVIGNKVFQFEGKIAVKNFTFYGDFVLEYEKFLVNLKRIDSVTFTPLNIYKGGGKKQLAGKFEFGKTGTLLLNSPDNKSGRRKLEEYPKLEIPDGVVVYFDELGRKHSFGREVYFKAQSLKLDSLNAKDPEIFGEFYTAGILKPIRDYLRMVPDSSMGMAHLPSGAYSVYDAGSALLSDTLITLDKSGIHAKGQLIHLSTTLEMDEINMFEEYAEAKGGAGQIEQKEIKGAYFPEVNIGEYNLHWNPSKDSMSVYSDEGFNFYNASTELKGSLLVKQTGLFGRGELGRADSDISSKSIQFNPAGFIADLATINVKTAGDESHTAFSGQNLKIDFNVQNSLVEISPDINDFNEDLTAFLEFPYSSYKTTIDQALWNIKDKVITMEGSLENSLFTSTARDQYDLRFYATGARYDINKHRLSMSGVEEIHSVDAAILPPDGQVYVQTDGKLEPFKNATIIADTLNRYHTLTNAEVTVNSRLSYKGNADYQYVNVSLDTFNIKLGGFEFAEVSEEGQILDSKGSGNLSTIAKARVSEQDGIYLANKMLYQGDLTMMAPFKNLYLDGQVLPELDKYPMIGGSWINYKGSKSENVNINIDETLRDGGKPLYVGLHMKYGVNMDGIYPTFLSMKGTGDDYDIFVAKGTFGRDEDQKHFYVHPHIEHQNSAEFYDETGILQLNGHFNLLGVPTKVFETIGTARANLDSMNYRFETMMLVDFPIPIPTTQKMGDNIVKANLDAGNTLAAVDPNSEDLIKKLKNFLGNNDTDKYLNEAAKGPAPLFKSSNKFLKTIVFSHLNLNWNPTANAYHSYGPIGISNIGDVNINAMVNGYVEIAHSHSTGNEFHIFLDLDRNSWYYFVFRNGQLNMVTSDEEVNRLINPAGKKEKDKTVSFINASEAARFKTRFLMNYEGLSEAELKEQPAKPQKTEKKEEEEEGF